MPRFRYQRGEKPLDGFTIEHGLGVGGFGEVYYAVSDAGREVALKAVQNYEEIELRGIRQCMNLKSPHLVTVFDVKHNEHGEPFVIMEYVQGPSLRQLLDNAPNGLGATKAAFFVREIAKGLTYLHDAGVVHRDLKPHNVFYEDGYVKIGDYSLCKMISTSHRTGHTMTVGTVHYMAPEISEGRYDASVDIYALGIMLFEMLTGTPPFVGDSIGEVLMKSMTAEPNLAQVNEPFRSAIAKAIAKDPDQRYSCAAELVEAIFGVEHVQNSVVEFNPQELTLVAHQAAKRVLATPSGRPASNPSKDSPTGHWPPPDRTLDKQVYVAEPAAVVSQGDTNKTGADYTAPGLSSPERGRTFRSEQNTALAPDTIHWLVRYALAAFSCVMISGAAQLLSHSYGQPGFHVAINILLMVVAISVIRLLALQHASFESALAGRLAIATALLAAISLPLPFLPPGGRLCAALPFVILDWHPLIHARRKRRLVLWPILASSGLAYFFGFSAIWFNGGTVYESPFAIHVPILCAAVAAGVGLWLQIASPKQLPIPSVAPTRNATIDRGQADPPKVATTSAAFGVATPAPVLTSPRPSTAHVQGLSVAPSKGMLVFPGIFLYAISSILVVLELSSVVQGFQPVPLHTTYKLALCGFGLALGSMGLMIASGTRREWAFVRLIAATGILAAIHYASLSMQSDISPMYLPVSIALFAWPSRQPTSQNQP